MEHFIQNKFKTDIENKSKIEMFAKNRNIVQKLKIGLKWKLQLFDILVKTIERFYRWRIDGELRRRFPIGSLGGEI